MAKVIERAEMLVTLKTNEGTFYKGNSWGLTDKIPNSIISEINSGTTAVRVTYSEEEQRKEDSAPPTVTRKRQLVPKPPANTEGTRESVGRDERRKAIIAKRQQIG